MHSMVYSNVILLHNATGDPIRIVEFHRRTAVELHVGTRGSSSSPPTTKKQLDPALLRQGRMDVNVHMSYCTPCGFRVLAANYIGIKDHELFGEIEEAIRTTELTPAEVAEQLMRNDDDLDALLNDLIQVLQVKERENEEAKVKKNHAQQESTVSEGGQTDEEENKSRE
ncbi:hypothetical protein SLEP1_g38509 [Rubroshorea leprosula]|nr:hypothetical protein SLEP1_g38509 [Rubroshorea leprosula]